MNIIGSIPLTGVKVISMALDFNHPVFIYIAGIKAQVLRTIAMLHNQDSLECLIGDEFVTVRKSWDTHLTSVSSALPITLLDGTVRKGWASALVYDRRVIKSDPEHPDSVYILSDDAYSGFTGHLQNTVAFPVHISWISYIWDVAHKAKLLTPLTGHSMSGWKLKLSHNWQSVIADGIKEGILKI